MRDLSRAARPAEHATGRDDAAGGRGRAGRHRRPARGDAPLAEKVIAGNAEIDRFQATLEEEFLDVLARQRPVASDLRILIAALRIASGLERMGDLAENIAKVARMRPPQQAGPPRRTRTISRRWAPDR